MYNSIIMNNNYCNKCGKCCKEILVDFSQRIIYRDGVQHLSKEFEEIIIPYDKKENVSICYCKFLDKNNNCTHPKKPEECSKYPSSAFAFIPEECGYYGEIFSKLEHEKQKIRKLKEEIIEYESKLQEDKSLIKIINRHKAYIEKYKIYGSYNW